MDAVTQVPTPVNEPVHGYAPGVARARPPGGQAQGARREPRRPADDHRRRSGAWAAASAFDVVQPHNHKALLGTYANATEQDAQDAIDAALAAAPGLARDVLRRPRRDHPARRRTAGRPLARDARRLHHARPVEDRPAGRDRLSLRAGRLLALQRARTRATCSPSSRPPTPRASGTVSTTARSRASSTRSRPSTSRPSRAICPPRPPSWATWWCGSRPRRRPTPPCCSCELLEEAGLPKGVINLVTGDGIEVSEVALEHRDLAGIHFTGSTKTFQYLWKTVGTNIEKYRSYPRLVGETGGKDFVVAHPSADRGDPEDGADPRRLRVPGPEVLARPPAPTSRPPSGTTASRRSSPPRSTA